MRTRLQFEERLCRNISSNQGFATIWYLVGMVTLVFLASMVLSSGYAIIQQNQIKQAMDRSVKAAVLQYDLEDVSTNATVHLNRQKAYDTFVTLMRQNLKLDAALVPTQQSVFHHPFQVVTFRVLNHGPFPYTVKEPGMQFQHTFQSPGIAAIVKTSLDKIWGPGETTYYVPAVAEIEMNLKKGTHP